MKLISWNLVHTDKQGRVQMIGNIPSDNFNEMEISKYCLLLRQDQLDEYQEKVKNTYGEALINYIDEMQKVSEKEHKLRKQYIKDWRQFQKQIWGEE